MALAFRYRYVDFGTIFTSAPGIRIADHGADTTSATLFSNELVTDVGGTCWGENEPLAILDHHFSCDNQFPSASAAVLHKAKLIREKFASRTDGVVWLVTHKQPDFDAFCSMYLARWIIDEPEHAIDWANYGLHSNGWIDAGGVRKIDWFNPDFNQIPQPQRWALLLASYASVVDNSRQLACPRQRALHSVLYAALKRGRDYLNETSGAREFFEAVRRALQQERLNPLYDSVLDGNPQFAPELAMLDREVEAYHRDIRRARKAIVYLPQSEAPFPNFFKSVKDVPLMKEKSSGHAPEMNAEHLLSGTFRVPTDGIYLRDPECLLFKEWARLDLGNSSLGAGFEFTAIAYSGGRPAGTINTTDYFFSIDPERANGRHLYTVWSKLQTKEVEALKAQGNAGTSPGETSRRGFEKRAGDLGRLFSDPWFDGQNYFGTIVATPNHGTYIGRPGVQSDLRDDPVVEAVRRDVEDSIYLAESPIAGPQIVVTDFSGSRAQTDADSQHLDLNSLRQMSAPAEHYFRFGSIPLRADVPVTCGGISRHGLSGQIAETLWQVLYPDLPEGRPADFIERHLVVTADCVGVWGHRGIVIAYKSTAEAGHQTEDASRHLRDDFADIVALARDVDQLIADGQCLAHGKISPEPQHSENGQARIESVAKLAAQGEDLARRAAQVRHNLTLPDRDLLRRFYEATAIDELVETLRDLNRSAAEHLRREKLADQTGRMEESTRTVAEVQSKLEWLEVFIVGYYATEMIELFTRRFPKFDAAWGTPFVLLGGLFSLIFTALILKPWERAAAKKAGSENRPLWILIIVIVSYVAGLILWAVFRNNAG